MSETRVTVSSASERSVPLTAAPAGAQQELTRRGLALVTALRIRAKGLLPYVDYGVQRLGRSGITGLALLVFSVVFVLSTNAPLRTEQQALRAAVERVGGHASGPVATPAAQVDSFVHSLPRQADLPRVTAQLFEQAKTAGIELERGTYELLPARAGQLARYRISYPVKGTYPAVRQFIDGALLVAPAVALESMRVERPNVADPRIEADLRFEVMLRSD